MDLQEETPSIENRLGCNLQDCTVIEVLGSAVQCIFKHGNYSTHRLLGIEIDLRGLCCIA